MKVKDLLRSIAQYRKSFGDDLLEWEVYTEQCTEADKKYKRKPCRKDIPPFTKGNGQGWGIVKDSEKWEYFECAGYHTCFAKEKIFTINVNY